MADGFDVLKAEHAEITQFFDRYSESKDEAVIRELCEALAVHTQVEEQVVYPEMRRLVDGGDDLADRLEQEHAAVKVLVERLELAPGEDLSETVAEMRGMVEAHATEEDDKLFPEMREAGVDPESLATRIAETRAAALSRGQG